MTLLEVLHFPDPRLRKKAEPVTTIDEGSRTLAKNMLETMYHNHGIGLAATQVNQQKRIVVMDLSEDCDQPLYLINPQILSLEGEQKSREGCLSVPEYYDTIKRAAEITFQYQDLQGKMIKQQAQDLLAICIQHEIDHLDGKLFIDLLSPLKRQRLQKKIEKQKKLQATT